jgi:hypothetical protein
MISQIVATNNICFVIFVGTLSIALTSSSAPWRTPSAGSLPRIPTQTESPSERARRPRLQLDGASCDREAPQGPQWSRLTPKATGSAREWVKSFLAPRGKRFRWLRRSPRQRESVTEKLMVSARSRRIRNRQSSCPADNHGVVAHMVSTFRVEHRVADMPDRRLVRGWRLVLTDTTRPSLASDWETAKQVKAGHMIAIDRRDHHSALPVPMRRQ